MPDNQVSIEERIMNVDATPESGSGDDSVMSRLMDRLDPQEEVENDTSNDGVDDAEDREEEESEDSTEDSDDDDSEASDTEDDESGEEDEDDDTEESEEDVLTQEQLAEVLGLPEGAIEVGEEGTISIKTKVDGAEEYVPLEKLVGSYQLEKHLRNKSSEQAEAKRQFEEHAAQKENELGQYVMEATSLVGYLEQQILDKYSPTKMERLRLENPAEWAAQGQELQSKRAEIAQVKSKLQGVIQQKASEQQQIQAQKLQEYINTQTEKLVECIPEWSTPEVFVKENTAIQNFVMEEYGFTADEYNATNDHRMFLMMRDAARGKALKGVKSVSKKLKTVPKIVKPGSPKVSKSSLKKKAEQKKRDKIKSAGGNVDSIAAALIDRM